MASGKSGRMSDSRKRTPGTIRSTRWLPPQPRHLFRHGGAGAEGHRRGAEITGPQPPSPPDGLFRAPFPNGGSGKFANREDSVASINAPSPAKIFQKSSRLPQTRLFNTSHFFCNLQFLSRKLQLLSRKLLFLCA